MVGAEIDVLGPVEGYFEAPETDSKAKLRMSPPIMSKSM